MKPLPKLCLKCDEPYTDKVCSHCGHINEPYPAMPDLHPISTALVDATKPKENEVVNKCQRIGGCLHDLGHDKCCCDDNSCDHQKQPTDTEILDWAILYPANFIHLMQTRAHGGFPEQEKEQGRLAIQTAMNKEKEKV